MLSANDPARSDYIDGLRAIAVGAVLCFHAGVPGVPGGYLGVDVFFVISGFLITAQIFDGVDGGRFSVVNFYARRILRIWPPLFLVIAVTLIASCLLPIMPLDLKRIGNSAIASAAMVSNWYFRSQSGYFEPVSEREPLLHIWSLGVEEQYYLFVPALVLGLALVARRWTIDLYTLGLYVTLAGLLGSLGAAYGFAVSKPDLVFYATPLRIWEFAVGAAAILSIRCGLVVNRHVAGAALLLGVVAIVAACALTSLDPLDRLLLQVLAIAGAGSAILSGGFAEGGLMKRLLCLRPMVGIGLVSYSLYLWHWPLLSFWRLAHIDAPTLTERIVIGIIAPLLLAILTYIYVELPARGFRRNLALPVVRGRVVVVGVGVSTVVGLCALAIVSWSTHLSISDRYRAFTDAAWSGPTPPCPAGAAPTGPSALCASQAGATTGVLLWGDSHSHSIWAAVADASRTAGRSAQLQWEGNCPPLIGTPFYVGSTPWERCAGVNETIMGWLSSTELKDVTGVVLAANWRYGQTLLSAADTSADRAAKLGEAVGRTLAALRARGLRVLVLGQVPPLPHRAPECMFLASDVRQCSALRGPLDAEQHDFTAALRSAVAPFDNARFVDVEPALCDTTSCASGREGQIYYIDATHLSDAGARAVRAYFASDFAWVVGSTERGRPLGEH
jgi:peptidoglycan/LPS O-acetylase OafA/YrhL